MTTEMPPLKFSPLNMQEICKSYSKDEFANQTKNTIRRLDESATPNKSTQLHLLVFPSVLILGWNVNIAASQAVNKAAKKLKHYKNFLWPSVTLYFVYRF